ncbi:response regulator transcription factor [Streptomyces sp. NBC_01275]|uniref:response regulator transcription factor n=1 Tax=Streptomyces sp. NBC_01275 TaxID=2903807 RepID=UPI002252FF54|nr:response regulator transcription factor [Streptomyces sp. NBC_01275]MCX4766156.1 response regulator transcription factor [Streptomyces sp. NBC_01275]
MANEPTDRVLVVDDDRAVRESLGRALELAGYDVVTAADGVEALTRTRGDSFSALVVDVMMPHIDGVAVCRVLRAGGDRTPVLMLTARAGVPDRINGLDAGADDYLSKPFEIPELLARLRALLRRTSWSPETGTGPGTGTGTDTATEKSESIPARMLRTAFLRTASLRIAPAARRVWWADEELHLSKTEFDLLELLVRNEGLVLDHATLYGEVWGPEAGVDARNLAGYVGYLRRKLADAGAPDLIHTVRGVGYAVRRP